MRRLSLLFSLVLFAALPVRAQDDLPEVRPLVFEESVEVPGVTVDELRHRWIEWTEAVEHHTEGSHLFFYDYDHKQQCGELSGYFNENEYRKKKQTVLPFNAMLSYHLLTYVKDGGYSFVMKNISMIHGGWPCLPFTVDPLLDGKYERLNKTEQRYADWARDFFAAYFEDLSASLRKVMTAEPDIVLE